MRRGFDSPARLRSPKPTTLNRKGNEIMYFAIDETTREIVDQNGVRFTTDQFQAIRERYARLNKPLDMTLSCQRLVSYNYNWDNLAEYYRLAG